VDQCDYARIFATRAAVCAEHHHATPEPGNGFTRSPDECKVEERLDFTECLLTNARDESH
jgi:hypothetical protein